MQNCVPASLLNIVRSLTPAPRLQVFSWQLPLEYDLPVRSTIPVSVAFKEYYGATSKDRGAELAWSTVS